MLDYTALIFTCWQDYRDGKIERTTCRAWMTPARAQGEDCLQRAGFEKLSGSCADTLAHPTPPSSPGFAHAA